MASSSALRLRKYVAEEGSSGKLNENFCLIGTPLPSLDSKKHDANEYKPLWEQEVRDEQGRRRLHGAFTGGWSAGYYNTAGSKEGWTPSTFKSSRKDKEAAEERTKVREQRPEDFMDEEDLMELKAGRTVGASEAYAYGEQKTKASSVYDPLLGALGPAPTETSGTVGGGGSVTPARHTLGLKLLTRMGWRPGTGLGPRVSSARHRALSILAGLAPSSSLEGAQAAALVHNGVAPPDSKLLEAVGWEGRRGLGSDKRGSTKVEGLQDAVRRARREAAAAAPGDDTYGADAVYALGDDIHSSTLARPRQRRASLSLTTAQSQSSSHQPKFDPSENRWSDGRAVLRGFRIAAQALAKQVWFAPPTVPKGWEPDPQRVWAVDVATKPGPGSADQDSAAPRPPGPPPIMPPAAAAALKPDDRASILGEAKNPGPPPSIMHYLSAKDRERLERVREAASVPGSFASASLPTPLPVTPVIVPPTESRTAQAALSGFTPFASDTAKQQRYTYYLQSQAFPTTSPHLFTPQPGQTVEALNHELREFAKSAGIFRPLNTAMSSRFTSAVNPSGSASGLSGEVEPAKPGLYQPTPKGPTERADMRKPAPEPSRDEELLSPAQAAARSGMFGPLTRSLSTWVPEKLLCKRFGVAPPKSSGEEATPAEAKMSQGAEVPKSTTLNAAWEANRREIERMAKDRAWEGMSGMGAYKFTSTTEPSAEFAKGGLRSGAGTCNEISAAVAPVSAAISGGAPTISKAPSKTLANVGLGEDETQGSDTLTYVKPSMDIFKAVFASDDEDEDDEEAPPVAPTSICPAVPVLPGRNPDTPALAQALKPAQQSSATISMAPAPVVARPPGPDASDPSVAFRPTFVAPLKRRVEADEAEAVGSTAPAGTAEEPVKKKLKKKDKKAKPKGMLTFDLDEE